MHAIPNCKGVQHGYSLAPHGSEAHHHCLLRKRRRPSFHLGDPRKMKLSRNRSRSRPQQPARYRARLRLGRFSELASAQTPSRTGHTLATRWFRSKAIPACSGSDPRRKVACKRPASLHRSSRVIHDHFFRRPVNRCCISEFGVAKASRPGLWDEVLTQRTDQGNDNAAWRLAEVQGPHSGSRLMSACATAPSTT